MFTGVPEADVPDGVHCLRSFPERALGYPLNYLPTINDWRHVGSRLQLGRLTRKDFDVVHLHNIHGDWISIKAVADLCRRIPAVWTLHDEWAVTGGMPYDLTRVLPMTEAQRLVAASGMPARMPSHPGPWATRWHRFLSRNIPRPAQIITPSQWLANLAREAPWFEDIPIETIPNGLTLLDEPAIHMPGDAARARWSVPQDRPCVLLIAADLRSPYKGMHLAIETLAHMDAAMAPADRPTVLLMGRGSESLAAAIQSKATLEVRTGWADTSADLAAAYRASDVTLIPSVADNLPYIVLESYACETPVLPFAVGGMPEAMSDFDIVDSTNLCPVLPFDTQGMAETLKKVLSNHHIRKRYAEEARCKAISRYEFKQYLGAIESEYTKVRG